MGFSLSQWIRFLLFAFVVGVSAKSFTYQLDSLDHYEAEIDLDPYYSAADLIFSITQDSIPRLAQSQERGAYSYLFFNMGHPRFGLLEVSVNPLPLAGTLLHQNEPQFYSKAALGQLNVFDALTAGFPEPWAMSYFLGNVVDLVDSNDPTQIRGKGFGGALISVGNYNILANTFVKDLWAEGELKLKGSTITPINKMSWSFRIGTKIHANPEIYDVLYFSVKRDRVDLKEPLTWDLKNLILRNSDIEFRSDIRVPRDWKLWDYFTQFLMVAGKKWPSKNGDYAWSLSGGLQLQLQNGYKGSLASRLPAHSWSIILRPNMEF